MGVDLQNLISLVRKQKPCSLEEVKELVEVYFDNEVVWSLERQEWDEMNEPEKVAFYEKLLGEV